MKESDPVALLTEGDYEKKQRLKRLEDEQEKLRRQQKEIQKYMSIGHGTFDLFS